MLKSQGFANMPGAIDIVGIPVKQLRVTNHWSVDRSMYHTDHDLAKPVQNSQLFETWCVICQAVHQRDAARKLKDLKALSSTATD